MITICMATYNGEDLLAEQLATLASQSLLPSELIVCDDASHDGTVRILETFASSAPFRVRVVQNSANLGWARALRRGVCLANSDLIALADQDDRWLPHKLECAALALRDNPTVEAVAGDSLPFSGDSADPQRPTMWRVIRRRGALLPDIHILAQRNFISAHNLVVRRSSLERFLWPDEALSPDYWLALAFSARGSLLLINKVLVHHRLHPRQSVGLARAPRAQPEPTPWEAAASTIELFISFATVADLDLEADVVATLQEHACFLRRRAAYIAAPRREWRELVRLMRSPRSYWKFAHSYRSLAADLLALGQAGATLA